MTRLLIASSALFALSSCCCDVPHAREDAGTGGGSPSGGGLAGSGGFSTGGGLSATGGGSATGGSATQGGGAQAGGGFVSTGGSTAAGGGTTAPPPTVTTALAPTSGAYGTRLTLLGSGFGTSGSVVLASSIGDITVNSSAFDSDAGELWKDDEVVFRYPFPAEGAVHLTNAAGTASAGAFTPSWIPGASISEDQDDFTYFPSATLTAAGTVVGVIRYADSALTYNGWGVMAHDGLAPQLFHLDVPSHSVVTIALVPDAGTQPDGVALVSEAAPDGGVTFGVVYRLGWAGGLPGLQSTGFSAMNALGGGYDNGGFFAWVQATDAGLVRLRPGSPVWTVDKTLAPPTDFGNGGKTSQTIFLNGQLVVQWTLGRDTGFPFFQHFEHPQFAFANGGQTAWNATEIAEAEIEGQVDGVNVSTSPDGKLAYVMTGGRYDPIFAELNQVHREVRKSGGGFIHTPTLGDGGSYVLAATSTDFAGAGCDDQGLRVARPVPGPQSGAQVDPASVGEVAVWPCPRIGWQVVVDSDGGVMTLVQSAKHLFLVKKR